MENFKELSYKGVDFLVGDKGTIYKNGKPAVKNVNADGYLQIYIPGSCVSAHRLVAMCFVDGRTDEKNEVNHKDFNRQNNCASNLEWVTHAENIRYSARNGRMPDYNGARNPNYGNKSLHNHYMEDPEYAIEKQSRPGAKNGRARPIDVYKDGEFIGHFDYLGECSSYMHEHYGFPKNAESFRSQVRKSIQSGVPYKGFTFIKN